MKRGFTGKVTADGKAIVKFQNRLYSVPATRLGITPRSTQTSEAALSTRWTPQKQRDIRSDIERLAGGPPGGGGGGGSTSGGKPGISGTFNSTANRPGEVAKVSSPQIQARIDAASFVKKYPNRLDYSSRFESETKNFNAGSKKVFGKIAADMILIQYHDSNAKIGESRSLMWWTSTAQANSMDSIRAVKGKLALPWGERNSVSVARIPAGTEVEYVFGTARSQDSSDFKTYTAGGGEQFMFRNFDPNWIVETRKIPNE